MGRELQIFSSEPIKNMTLLSQCSFRCYNFMAELFFFNFTQTVRGVSNKQKPKKERIDMHTSCIDPPQKRNPDSRSGFQAEPSHNNSGWFPVKGNPADTIASDSAKVNPLTQPVVDNYFQSTTSCGARGSGISSDQQELLNRLHPRDRRYGLLLALHGELTPENCEQETVYDGWGEEILRRANNYLGN